MTVLISSCLISFVLTLQAFADEGANIQLFRASFDRREMFLMEALTGSSRAPNPHHYVIHNNSGTALRYVYEMEAFYAGERVAKSVIDFTSGDDRLSVGLSISSQYYPFECEGLAATAYIFDSLEIETKSYRMQIANQPLARRYGRPLTYDLPKTYNANERIIVADVSFLPQDSRSIEYLTCVKSGFIPQANKFDRLLCAITILEESGENQGGSF